MEYTTLFFDLDDTIYSGSTGLWDAIRSRMSQYMVEKIGLPEVDVPALRRSYYEIYGTTLRGLQTHHQVDAEDYLAYVHNLPLEDYLQPSQKLRSMLLSLPQSCWIFTNADDEHANRVLDYLYLSDCFDGIIDVKAIDFACKPELVAYQRALTLSGNPDPQGCVLLDDAALNLITAREMGFTTVLVNSNDHFHQAAVHTIPELSVLPDVMPELWQ